MTREEIEKAAAEYFRGLECPEPDEIAAFTIQIHNAALRLEGEDMSLAQWAKARAAEFFASRDVRGTMAKHRCKHDHKEPAIACWECGPEAIAAALCEVVAGKEIEISLQTEALRASMQKNDSLRQQLDQARAVIAENIEDRAQTKHYYEHELTARERELAEFADAYPCHCAQNYPGPTAYHGHDCQSAVVQEFVAQFAAHKDHPK